eukprot:1428284-Amphidinium_carterae.1
MFKTWATNHSPRQNLLPIPTDTKPDYSHRACVKAWSGCKTLTSAPMSTAHSLTRPLDGASAML